MIGLSGQSAIRFTLTRSCFSIFRFATTGSADMMTPIVFLLGIVLKEGGSQKLKAVEIVGGGFG